jgi:SAM-dependent methyltransferase
MTTDGLFPIDFRVWADYWDLLEHHGVNAENAYLLQAFLASPILVVGSGQGLLSLHLLDAGYDVCSIDKSATMAEYAARRRHVSTTVCDAVVLRLPQRFRGIVVTTGIINTRTIEQGLLPPLLENIDRHMAPGGRVAFSYFSATSWTDVAHELGLYGRPSNNVIFWIAHGDLTHAVRLFAVHLGNPEVVRRAFDSQPTKLSSHMESILTIGKRYVELHDESPDRFIADHSGYYPFPLSRSEESTLLKTLVAHRMCPLSVLSTNDGDTTMIVCERAAE